MTKRKRKSIKARNGSKTMAGGSIIMTVKSNGKVSRPKRRKR